MAEDDQKNKAPQQQQRQQLGESATPTIREFGDIGELIRSIKVHKELKVGPSVVGLTEEEATKKIKEEVSEARIEVIRAGDGSGPGAGRMCCIIACNYERVRLWVDSSGKVVKVPYIG